jgi:hypothetical protein
MTKQQQVGSQIGDMTIYRLEELEKLFDVKEYTLRQYVRERKLKARKVGKGWYVSSKALEEFFDQYETPEEETED